MDYQTTLINVKNPAFLSRKSIILSKGKGWRGNNSIGQKI